MAIISGDRQGSQAMATYLRAVLVTGFCVVLAACGGGGSSPSTGPLTLSVTDSPIDPNAISDVCIAFTGMTVHYASQPGRDLGS